MANTTKDPKPVLFEDIVSVYSGKDGRCYCGCAGTHSYASAHREEAGKRRGYAIKDDEVNDDQVRRIMGIINRNLPSADMSQRDDKEPLVTVVLGKRAYTVYLLRKGC